MSPKLKQCLAALIACAGAEVTHAADPTFQIQQLYSNADGTIQFVQLRESTGQDGQDQFAGLTLTATKGTRAKVFTFPGNLPNAKTANRSVLVATQGYLNAPAYAPEFHLVPPDYIVPDQFLATEGGTVSFAGADSFTYAALPRDGFSAVYRSGNTIRDNLATDFGGAAASLPPLPVTAVEYFNASLDHYFISDLAADIEALDSGRISGWTRTGRSFRVWPISQGFLNNVCRFYIPPEHGNSHFFSASPVECAAVTAHIGTDPNYSGYILETAEAFSLALPDSAGGCAQFWVPVYRLWNNRVDSNHRYTTDPAVKAQMIARGYVPEGYGADAVSMCSPLN